MPRAKHSHIVVVGAGAFGGWTALFLRRQGARVTLLARIRGRHISTFQLIDEEEYRAGLERAERELPDTAENTLEWLIATAVRG